MKKLNQSESEKFIKIIIKTNHLTKMQQVPLTLTV